MDTEKITECKDTTNFKSYKYLNINSCGKQEFSYNTYPVLRSHGRVDYHILYIIEGECVTIKDDEEITLKAGQMILFKPHEKQYYRFIPPHSVSYWIHFTGIGAEQLLKSLNLWTKSIYRPGLNECLMQIFDAIIYENTMKEHQYQIICEGKLMELLGLISRISATVISDNFSDNRNLIYGIIEQIQKEPHKKFASEEMAMLCGLSRSRFEHVFKEVTGMPPYRYMLKARISKACYLLKNTQLNVSEICDITGFNDPLYFSRIFKKFNSCSPTEYRRGNV